MSVMCDCECRGRQVLSGSPSHSLYLYIFIYDVVNMLVLLHLFRYMHLPIEIAFLTPPPLLSLLHYSFSLSLISVSYPLPFYPSPDLNPQASIHQFATRATQLPVDVGRSGPSPIRDRSSLLYSTPQCLHNLFSPMGCGKWNTFVMSHR